MASRPVNLSALRALSKIRGGLEHEIGDAAESRIPRDAVQFCITEAASGERPNIFWSWVQPRNQFLQLLKRVIAPDKDEAFYVLPLFRSGYRDKAFSEKGLDAAAFVEGCDLRIESEHTEPLGEFSEHHIDNETFLRIIGG
jgi:hypothetical protein